MPAGGTRVASGRMLRHTMRRHLAAGVEEYNSFGERRLLFAESELIGFDPDTGRRRHLATLNGRFLSGENSAGFFETDLGKSEASDVSTNDNTTLAQTENEAKPSDTCYNSCYYNHDGICVRRWSLNCDAPLFAA